LSKRPGYSRFARRWMCNVVERRIFEPVGPLQPDTVFVPGCSPPAIALTGDAVASIALARLDVVVGEFRRSASVRQRAQRRPGPLGCARDQAALEFASAPTCEKPAALRRSRVERLRGKLRNPIPNRRVSTVRSLLHHLARDRASSRSRGVAAAREFARVMQAE